MHEVTIRRLRDAEEARVCAEFVVASDPWITLRTTFDQVFKRLNDPACEVHVAVTAEKCSGVLVLNLAGLLNGYIQLIAVHPDWRGRGVGTRLIEFAEDRIFQQSPNVFLCVSSFNVRAQALYRRLGYQQVGELPDYVIRGASEFLMRKTRGPLREFTPVRK